MKTEKLVTLKHSKNHLTIAFGKTMQCLYKQQNKGSWMSITRAEFGGDRVLVWELVEGCRAATPWYVLHPLSLVKSCFFSLRHRREQEKKEKKEIWLWLYYLCFQGSYKYKNKHEGSHFGHCLKDCKNSHCESELYSKEEKKKEYSISLLFVNANWVTPEKNWKALNLPFQHTWRHMSHGTSYLFIYLYFGFFKIIFWPHSWWVQFLLPLLFHCFSIPKEEYFLSGVCPTSECCPMPCIWPLFFLFFMLKGRKEFVF